MSSKLCSKCNKSFSSIWTNPETGKTHSLQRRKFCLECSPFGHHNTKDITIEKPSEFTCPSCKETKEAKDFFIRKDRPGNKSYSYCKQCHSNNCVKRQQKVKQTCIDYLGGKCKVCGYDKCNRALSFHHLDSSQKDFDIAMFKNRSFEKVKAELDKCVLLCSNCHAEVHSNLTQL